VVDEDIKDEVRVTVVATGIGGIETENFTSPTLVSSLSDKTETQGIYDENIDSVLDSKKEKLGSANQDEESDTSYLDIPAFLRRQAD
jgi:cell division protein FtsZ